MKTVFKVLPMVIGCALLMGISSASASCSYVGVTVGQTQSYIITQIQTNSSGSKTFIKNADVKVDNITAAGSYCVVGMTMTETGGNWTGSGFSGGTTVNVMDTTSLNMSTAFWAFVISTNVSNKSYYYYSSSGADYGRYLASWDSSGLLQSMVYSIYTSGYYQMMKIERPAAAAATPPEEVTPGYDTWAVLLAGGIGIASVIGIALKKHH